MIRRASLEKLPSHMMRQSPRQRTTRDKIKIAQNSSLSQRDVKVTLKKAPWEEKRD